MTRKVVLVEDEAPVREALTQILEGAGLRVEAFASAEDSLTALRPGRRGCLLCDVRLPGMSGPELQATLKERGVELPIIFLTGKGDVATATRTLKAGAFDFLEKPIRADALVERVRAALALERERYARSSVVRATHGRLARLTPREREIMALVAAGRSSKEIARRLAISHRTVEVHRAHIMQKTDTHTTLELARLADSLQDSGDK